MINLLSPADQISNLLGIINTNRYRDDKYIENILRIIDALSIANEYHIDITKDTYYNKINDYLVSSFLNIPMYIVSPDDWYEKMSMYNCNRMLTAYRNWFNLDNLSLLTIAPEQNFQEKNHLLSVIAKSCVSENNFDEYIPFFTDLCKNLNCTWLIFYVLMRRNFHKHTARELFRIWNPSQPSKDKTFEYSTYLYYK